ncbi:elongation factor ts [Moesziomyces antarcticus]|uniref:Probable Elongation factor Ts, mitochondrial n=1 Tax=Pseudozyma antarctica TaxID=84753 RepID=A0A5C3FHU8_PSEA2|nr:elongation factor ts [Moesziomyces antarcticus]GAK63226.1 elongation factor ts [Moesziomyces antarcticus]SPO43287.1 probable Elongation factor Ts, mitochondrial [Moesziomyces antarcticus]
MSSSASVFRIARLSALRSSRISPSSSRSFSRTALVGEPKKPSIKAIAELRKLMPGTSMIKAKEALLASRPASSPDEDSIEAALEWLEADRRKSGAKKADKVAGRQAREGIVAVTVLSDGLPSAVELKGQLKDQAVSAGIGATGAAAGGIVEVNCETDFVAKNDVFTQLVKDIVHTVALFPALAAPRAEGQSGFVQIPVDQLLAFPLLPSSPEAQGSSVAPKTVGSAIIDVVSRLGEKISIARAAAIPPPQTPSADAPRRSETGTDRGASVLNLASAFAHGGSAGFAPAKDAAKPGYVLTSGKVASLLTTRFASPKLPDLLASSSDDVQTNIRALTRSLARQAAGMQTKSIRAHADNNAEVQGEVSTALYDQPFMMLLPAAAPSPESSAHPVQDVLRSWATHNQLEASDADAVQVLDMHRWELGETAAPVESSADDFAQEVRKAAGLA